ncbi:MAG: FkbM family methyltransferase [Gemmatimonadales bacterium]|nr:FkbM family methyltransferase [Gemmatimonadales bacterium]
MSSRTLSLLGGKLKRLVLRRTRGQHLELTLREVLTTVGTDLVLDVGANRGQFGRMLRDRIGYDGDLVSFEPLPGLAAELTRQAARDRRWVVVPCGLGDREGTARLNVARDSVFSSLLPATDFGRSRFRVGIEVVDATDVPVHRLDRILPETVPDFRQRRIHLKVDTQGFDLNVIRGAGDLIGGFTSMQVELPIRPSYVGAPNGQELLGELADRGFDLVGLFPVARDGLRLVDADAVLVNRSFSNPV